MSILTMAGIAMLVPALIRIVSLVLTLVVQVKIEKIAHKKQKKTLFKKEVVSAIAENVPGYPVDTPPSVMDKLLQVAPPLISNLTNIVLVWLCVSLVVILEWTNRTYFGFSYENDGIDTIDAIFSMILYIIASLLTGNLASKLLRKKKLLWRMVDYTS